MSRTDAHRRKARAERFKHSQSFASLRQRLSQLMVRSTTHRFGSTVKPLLRPIFDDLHINVLHDVKQACLELRAL